ncbi:MAG: gamma carbonic anhydrase family protein [Dehalococcoidia bacterium]|nr:gamma carbonic anhydrase family protein [Dehalococcoidia bacterium]
MIKSFRGVAPKIADSSFVSQMASVIGDVEIGENSGVWPGAVIRADIAPIKIGAFTQIEDCAVIHGGTPMSIGDNVFIGHSAVVHCIKIGHNVLVGNNATVLEQVEIGDFCVIAAGALVTPGTKIPDHSFVAGVPGTIRGRPTAKMLDYIEGGMTDYVRLAAEAKAEGL